MTLSPTPINPHEIIYAKDQLVITVSEQASKEAIDLLKRTVYGTHGPKYQHMGQEKKCLHISDPYFFNMWVNEKLAGTYCLSGRVVNIKIGKMKSYYGRYLTIHPPYMGKGYGQILKRKAIEYMENVNKQPYLLYSYIEEHNQRSLKISESERFLNIGKLDTVVFSRLYPKKDKRFQRLDSSALSHMLGLLEEAYKDYCLVNFEKVYYEQNYFVLKEQGEIIAGVQANPIEWRIIDLPGLSGKMIIKIVPKIPIVKRLFNPEKYQFVALEALYFKAGREDDLFILLESVIAHFQYTSALIVLDEKSSICKLLKDSGKLGIMNSLKSYIYTFVMTKANGFDSINIKAYESQPIYTCSFDYT